MAKKVIRRESVHIKGSSKVPVRLAKVSNQEPLILTASIQDVRNEWVLDSGASFRITPKKVVLFDLKEVDGGKVWMGNNTFSEIKRVGKIHIKGEDGSIMILIDVKFMPKMGRNLISYGCLEKAGCTYEGGDYRMKFFKDGIRVLIVKYADGLYYLEGTILNGENHTTIQKVSVSRKWHSILGHISQKGLDLLVKEGYLEAKDVDTLGFCEDCLLGKAHRQNFKKGKHTSREILEYIHSNLWGAPSVFPSLTETQV